MILVALLTIEQKNILVGQTFCTDSFFNPIQDINDNWIISLEELNHCENQELEWVKDLPLIEYIQKESPINI